MAGVANAAPAGGPSFDCARATRTAERAICRDPSLVALDRRIAARFATADGDAGQQRRFIASRDRCGANRGCLRRRMNARLAQLAGVGTVAVFGGEWRASEVAGSLTVTTVGSGEADIRLATSEPTTARWTCEPLAFRARLTGGALVGNVEGGTVRIERRGNDRLTVTADPAIAQRGCGLNGTYDGEFSRGKPTPAASIADERPEASARGPRRKSVLARSHVIGERDFTLRGRPACEIRFRYAGHAVENLFWEEPCHAVAASMVTKRELAATGKWSRLDSFDQTFVAALPGGRVLYVEGRFSASVYPIGTTGATYEVSVAD